MARKSSRKLTEREIKKRRDAYDESLKKQITHDQPKILEVKQHIDELSKSITNKSDGEDSSSSLHLNALNQWKKRNPQVTTSNVAPFTPTGDINDAVFNPPISAAHD